MLQISYRGIAQLVEQRSPKPRAVSSSLTTPATLETAQTLRLSRFYVINLLRHVVFCVN